MSNWDDDGETVQVILPYSPEFFNILKEFKKIFDEVSYRVVEDENYILTFPSNGTAHQHIEAMRKLVIYKLEN